MTSYEKRLMIVGAVSSSAYGQTVLTEALLKSRLTSEFVVYHLDTSDHRSIDNIGRLDPGNTVLALKNIVLLAFLCMTRKPDIVYVPNSQNNMAFFRDGLLIPIARLLILVTELCINAYFPNS
jgi:hypothetical protein